MKKFIGGVEVWLHTFTMGGKYNGTAALPPGKTGQSPRKKCLHDEQTRIAKSSY
jgi:hypothetical protein